MRYYFYQISFKSIKIQDQSIVSHAAISYLLCNKCDKIFIKLIARLKILESKKISRLYQMQLRFTCYVINVRQSILFSCHRLKPIVLSDKYIRADFPADS